MISVFLVAPDACVFQQIGVCCASHNRGREEEQPQIRHAPPQLLEMRLRAGEFLNDAMRSVSFLSRIPVHDIFFEGPQRSIAETAGAFPLAGLFITLPIAILASCLASTGADALVISVIVLVVATLVTGALHEDGLADTADGFGGGNDKTRALAIMKDSRIGTYGAMALISSFVIRAACLAALVREVSALSVAAILLAIACVSRALMVWHWQSLPPAKDAGIAVAAGQPGKAEARTALAFGFAATILIALPIISLKACIAALAASIAATYLFSRFCRRKIDGHTGDTIGATQQITEIVMLASLALFA